MCFANSVIQALASLKLVQNTTSGSEIEDTLFELMNDLTQYPKNRKTVLKNSVSQSQHFKKKFPNQNQDEHEFFLYLLLLLFFFYQKIIQNIKKRNQFQ